MRSTVRAAAVTSSLALAMTILISGCETAKTDPPVSRCPAWLDRIVTSDDDVLTRATKERVAQHNEDVLCECWGRHDVCESG